MYNLLCVGYSNMQARYISIIFQQLNRVNTVKKKWKHHKLALLHQLVTL